MKLKTAAVFVLVSAFAGTPAALAAATPRTLYTQALARERGLRDGSRSVTLAQLRSAVAAYEALARKYPASGYTDNALWQGGNLALLAFDRFGQAVDKRTGIRLLSQLTSQYASSSLVAEARSILRQRDNAAPAPPPVAPTSAKSPSTRAAVPSSAVPSSATPSAAAVPTIPRPRVGKPGVLPRFMPPVLTEGMKPLLPGDPVARTDTAPDQASEKTAKGSDHGLTPKAEPKAGMAPKGGSATIRDVKRTSLPDGMRVTIELDAESPYHSEQIENPRRVFFDLRGAKPSAALLDASLKFTDDIVREIRLGRHPTATRVVMDMTGAESYSVFTLYDPFRVVVDFKRAATPTPPPAPPPALPVATRQTPAQEADSAAVPDAKPIPSRPITATPPPTLPAANLDGKFSLARQLGLGISRIVIDAGHGGHDPGAQSNGLAEAELTLDVALRLSRLLQKQPGVEVVLTRNTDAFIPLEERTAIANREGADLFLSIHANASRNSKARGVETYFLNFASNPEAEAVAARENSGSAQTMHRLPEIVKAIALNNKLDESRDFAEMVQKSMVRRLSARNKQLRDLGVKQAPFVVLIGAAMPSVLAEISFVTHKQEGSLLRTGAYRQQIAESLLDAVVKYQQSLKKLRGGTATQAMTK